MQPFLGRYTPVAGDVPVNSVVDVSSLSLLTRNPVVDVLSLLFDVSVYILSDIHFDRLLR